MENSKSTKTALRAVLLLRVSTAKQVNGNDDCPLPVQQNRCTEVCKENGWTITDVVNESKSGFKNDMYKRKAILKILALAEAKEFDVLVIFKQDRLGRRGNQTTEFIAKLISLGIRIFSATEGEIKLDSINSEVYVTLNGLWAKNESENISIRVKEAMVYTVENGSYRGGAPMFGYKTEETGVITKKGRVQHRLVVNEDEAYYVRRLFTMTVNEGKGTTQLANYLNNNGLRTHKGAKFQANNIMRILRNPLYIGHNDTSTAKAPYQEELRIIDDETFLRTQDILDQRSKKHAEERAVSLTNLGSALLSGNVFCAECGARIVENCSTSKHLTKSGDIHKYTTHRYICCNRAHGIKSENCQSAYLAAEIDEKINEMVKSILANIAGSPEEEAINKSYGARIKELTCLVKSAQTELKKLGEKKEKLTAEIANVIIGESSFTSEQLHTALEAVEKSISVAEEKLKDSKTRLDNLDSERKAVESGYTKLTTWAEEFDRASVERKKMIIAEMFPRVELSRGYNVKVTVNRAFKPYMEITD